MDIAAAKKRHSHSFEQRFERSIPSCTVKVWECPCGAWNIRHFGCFNPGHDQNTLATLAAALEALEEAQQHRDQWKRGYRQAVEEGSSVLAQYEEANAHLEVAEDTIEEQHERLEEAQGKLEELERLTYDLHQRSGHPDSACLRCQFYAALRGTKEGE